jgi:Ca2+-transporting ATPase
MPESHEKKITPPYKLSVSEILTAFKSSVEGLSDNESLARLEKYGKNEISNEKRDSALKLLLEQFSDLLIIILIVSAIISFFIGQVVEATAIVIIVILAGVLGFVQEYRASKAIEALQRMASPHATVLRNGKEKKIEAAMLVPGDVILLAAGNTIPADARIIESHELQVNEAPLTGESKPVMKTENVIDKENLPVADMKNMVFSGTFVTRGRAKALVIATGMHTEFGKIAKLLQETKARKTPLQRNLDHLGKRIGVFSLALAFIMSALGYIIESRPFVEMFIWGIAIAVAVIPEALPAVVTISIALGVRRMSKRRALIRKLPAVETLGAVDVICSDKTGTLTKDQMTIREIYTDQINYFVTGRGYNPNGQFRIDTETVNPQLHLNLMKLLEIGVLCNDTVIDFTKNPEEVIGDPTEAAFLVAAAKAGLDYKKLREKYPRIMEIPFSSESKMMTTFHKIENEIYAYTKGAFEIILDLSDKILENGIERELTEEKKLEIKQIAYKNGEKAQRVLGLAYKKMDGMLNPENGRKNLIFVGFVGMIDPPRKEAKKAIKTAFKAGIRPVMITGDNEVTAVAVAREIGILKHGNSIAGPELESLSDEELEAIVDDTEVFARISPKHKLRIVDALMKKNHIVAMTGDGINDAPALKKADIGIAMGIKGTDVSREAADMILTDDNFASIVAAIEEGRSIFQNIRKYLVYLLSGNFGTVFALVVALVTVLPIPLTAVQILFINFLMDGLIAIALGVEPPEKGLMLKKPRKVNEGILNKRMLGYIFGIGSLIGIITIGFFGWGYSQGFSNEKLITLFFVTLIFSRLFNALNCRSFDLPALAIKFYNNIFLLVSYLISIVFTVIVVEAKVFHRAFHTTDLTGGEWLAAILISAWVWILVEVYKIIFIPQKTFKKI